MNLIHYRITPAQAGHDFQVELTLHSEALELYFYLPVWIPGSYCRRDYAKHLSRLQFEDEQGEALPGRQLEPSRWQLQRKKPGLLRLRYRIYARDVSVRGCYLDHLRALFNPCAACLMVEGMEHESLRLQFDLQGKHRLWQICGATEALPGVFDFQNYAELVDTPLMLAAQLQRFDFKVEELPHRFFISGDARHYDLKRLAEATERGCRAAFNLFGAFPKALQGREYSFMLHLTGQVRGGLEHRRSTLLMHRRDAMLQRRDEIELLGLIVHEYFHTWNVKDLLPARYQPYRLQSEQPDDLLWLFEGYTAYFDNWLLRESALIDEAEYWRLIAADINAYWSRPGRKVQSLAQASIEAWTKFYQGGENSAQISAHYYIQGSLAALCLDAWLQRRARLSLAVVLRRLWENFQHSRQGLTEALFRQQVAALLPAALRDEFQNLLSRLIHSTEALPLAEALAFFGQKLIAEDEPPSDGGFSWQNLKITALDEDSEAAREGLAIGDEIMAVDGEMAEEALLQRRLQQGAIGERLMLQVRRDGLIYHFMVELQPPRCERWRLEALSQGFNKEES